MSDNRQEEWIQIAMGLWDGLAKVTKEHPRDWVETCKTVEAFAESANAVMQFELCARSYDSELERRQKHPWESGYDDRQ